MCMKKIVITALSLFVFPFALVAAQQSAQEVEISTNEDLMREHGILNRLLLIYQEIAKRIDNHESFEIKTLEQSSLIARNFLENYHEKLEEEFIFPIFEKAGKQTELVKTLREQHDAGRKITDYILSHSKEEYMKDDVQKLLLSDYLKLYIRMFRPHEAREDTILFPELNTLITKEEYDKLGDVFEDKEHALFGEEGFEKTVNQVAEIEKKLGIYNLSQFTSQLKS